MYKSKSGLSDEKTQNPYWFMKKFLVLRDFGINTLDFANKIFISAKHMTQFWWIVIHG